MREFVILLVHLIVTVIRLAKPGGLRGVIAKCVLVRHQLLILNRGRKRAPKLRAVDRIIAGLCAFFLRPSRLLPGGQVSQSVQIYFNSGETPFLGSTFTPL